MKKWYSLLLIFVLTLYGCDFGRIGKINPATIVGGPSSSPQVTSISIVNNQVIVTGTNLQDVNSAKVQGSTNHTFDIESKSATQLVLNAKAAISFLVGGTFDFIIGNAYGAATFPVSFDLQDGQVTAPKLDDMGAASGQILQFNGITWGPANMASSQIYTGTYNATTDIPDIVTVGGPAGTFYIVSVAGTQNLGTGPISFAVGDWAIFDGTVWSKVPMGSSAVSTFNGRMGAVVPAANDYSWSMLQKTAGKITGSNISDIADVDVTGIADQDTLLWDTGTSKWIVGAAAASLAAGSVTNTELANGAVDSAKISDGTIVAADLATSAVDTAKILDGTIVAADLGTGAVDTTKILDGTIVNADINAAAAIAQSKIANLTVDLAAKEPTITATTTLQYYRGDKSFQTLSTAVVPENGNLYFLDSRVRDALLSGYAAGSALPLAPTDKLMEALAKLEGQIIANAAGTGDFKKDGSVAMTGNLKLGAYQINNDGDAEGLSFDTAGRATLTGTTAADYPLSITNLHTGSGSSSSLLMTSNGTPLSQIQTYVGASTAESYLTIATRSAGTLAEKVRITKDGNIGIRTTDPTLGNTLTPNFGLLALTGTGDASTSSGRLIISNNRTTPAANDSAGGIIFGSLNNSGTFTKDVATISSALKGSGGGNGFGGALYFGTKPDNTSGSTVRMTIAETGNVGVGTSSPNRLLEVAGPIRVSGSSAPSSPAAGDIYVDSGDSYKLKWHNGTTWQTAATSNGAGDFLKDGSVAMTGPLQASAGNVGAPSLAFAGDPNTGLYSAAADTIGFAVGGAEKMRVDSNGFVGIGTTTSTHALEVNVSSSGGAGDVIVVRNTNASGWADIRFDAAAGGTTLELGYGNPSSGWYADQTFLYTVRDFFITNGGTDLLTVKTSGNVGIGNSNPGYKLDVSGDLRITGTPYRNGGDIVWTVPSDARLKDVTGKYNRGLKEILKLEMIKFHYKKGNPKEISSKDEFTGVIAQEVQKQIPEAIKEDKDGFLSLNTTPIFWAMINAIKELWSDLFGIRREIASLKSENQALKQENSEIKAYLCSKDKNASMCK